MKTRSRLTIFLVVAAIFAWPGYVAVTAAITPITQVPTRASEIPQTQTPNSYVATDAGAYPYTNPIAI